MAWQATLDDYPTALAVSRDGALIAAGTAQGTLCVFNAMSGALIHTLAAHTGGVLALAFGRKALASSGQDGHARLWDVQSGNALAALAGGAGWVSHVQWTPDGKRLAIAAGKQVKLLDEQGNTLQQWQASAGINGAPRGQLSVTAPVLFGKMFVMPGIVDYLQRYPEMEVSALLLDRVVNLLEEGMDAGVRIGELPDSSMKAITVAGR